MKKLLTWLLPYYAMLPLACVMLFNLLVYSGTRLITAGRVHFDFSIPCIDSAIPFMRGWILIYVLSYVFWGIGFLVIGRESREVCYRFFSGEMIAKFLCLLCFLLIPTKMPDWPSGTFPINNFTDWLTQFIYNMDKPDNLFPSIHCLESWVVFRGSLHCKKVGNAYRVFALLFALSVFASTVLVKQHLVVDILGGVAVCEIGFFAAKRFRTERVFEAMNNALNRKFFGSRLGA